MSHYIARWCDKHGDWDEDVDNPGECPTCEREGIAPSQLREKKITELEYENAALREKLAAAEEVREACAKVIDELVIQYEANRKTAKSQIDKNIYSDWGGGCRSAAFEVRALDLTKIGGKRQ